MSLDLDICFTSLVLSGHATLALNGEFLLVYNLSTGIDLYGTPILPGDDPLQSFPFSTALRRISAVAVTRNDEVFVSGGPDGQMNVFDQRSGLRVACLPVGPASTFIQAVSV